MVQTCWLFGSRAERALQTRNAPEAQGSAFAERVMPDILFFDDTHAEQPNGVNPEPPEPGAPRPAFKVKVLNTPAEYESHCEAVQNRVLVATGFSEEQAAAEEEAEEEGENKDDIQGLSEEAVDRLSASDTLSLVRERLGDPGLGYRLRHAGFMAVMVLIVTGGPVRGVPLAQK